MYEIVPAKHDTTQFRASSQSCIPASQQLHDIIPGYNPIAICETKSFLAKWSPEKTC
jgi:hypothetical protein